MRIPHNVSPYQISPPRLLPAVSPPTATTGMQSIVLDGETFYVYKHPNLVGHYELYRSDVSEPGKLVSTSQFVVHGEGVWQRVGLRGGGKSGSKHENLEQRAKDVFEEIRDAYCSGFKSTNKTYRHNVTGKESQRQRYNEAETVLNDIRAKNRQRNQLGITVAPDTTLRIDAGNCSELAFASAKRATEKGLYAEVWKFKAADHGFAVVGHPLAGDSVNFCNWKNVYILDPWANIFCEAPDYTKLFKEKMMKWEMSGKIIIDNNGIEKSPNDLRWLNEIASGTKIRYKAPSPSTLNPWEHFHLY